MYSLPSTVHSLPSTVHSLPSTVHSLPGTYCGTQETINTCDNERDVTIHWLHGWLFTRSCHSACAQCAVYTQSDRSAFVRRLLPSSRLESADRLRVRPSVGHPARRHRGGGSEDDDQDDRSDDDQPTVSHGERVDVTRRTACSTDAAVTRDYAEQRQPKSMSARGSILKRGKCTTQRDGYLF